MKNIFYCAAVSLGIAVLMCLGVWLVSMVFTWILREVGGGAAVLLIIGAIAFTITFIGMLLCPGSGVN